MDNDLYCTECGRYLEEEEEGCPCFKEEAGKEPGLS